MKRLLTSLLGGLRLVGCLAALAAGPAIAQPALRDDDSPTAGREARLSAMLSGATLEGHFTVSGGQGEADLTSEKYTLGEVKQVQGDRWVFPTRIEYGDRDLTLPITLPIRWAGDTPVVVVDQLGLPGLGTVSARVMFFADHYAGYWQHGEQGGHLFGVIHRNQETEQNKEQPEPHSNKARQAPRSQELHP